MKCMFMILFMKRLMTIHVLSFRNLFGPERIRISMVEMQKQRGPDDCGLFAIAVATSLVHGAGLCTFRQDQMRRHVLGCFEEKLLCVFPTVQSWLKNCIIIKNVLSLNMDKYILHVVDKFMHNVN